MAADWRFFSVALSGSQAGTVRDELDLGNVTIIDRLKGVGSLSASIPLRSVKATPTNLDDETTRILATRDGRVMWSGPLLDADWQPGAERIALACESDWNLIRRRPIRSAQGMTDGTLSAGQVVFSSVDQFEIVDDLIDHANHISATGITVAWGSLSGVTRDRSFEADKGKSIGEAIEQLANVADGFDWALEPDGTPDNLTLTLRLHHPQRGRDTGYIVEWPSPGVLSAGLFRSSRDMATRFTAVGAGEGPEQIAAHVADPNLLGPLPLVEASGAWLDVTSETTLTEHAQRNLTTTKRGRRIPTVTLDPNSEPRLSTFILGDRMRVVFDDGDWAQLDSTYRVVGRTITIGEDGDETVTLEFAPLEQFSA